jgi:hypothetical protein
MAQNLDLHIDTSTGALIPAGSARNGVFPDLTRNDSYALRLRLLQQIGSGVYEDLDLTGVTIRIGIGNLDSPPTSGQFKLGLSAATSPAIAYNATTTALYNAISGIAGAGVQVETFGSGGSAWVITAATAGSAVTFSSQSLGLFPTSRVIVTPRVPASTGVTPTFLVQLLQSPAVFSENFTPASTAGVVTLSTLFVGSSSPPVNHTYLLRIGSDVDSGFLSFAYDTEASIPVSLAVRSQLATNVVCGLQSMTAVSGNTSVDIDNSQTKVTITLVNDLGAQNATTPALTLVTSGVIFSRFHGTTLTMATAELLHLFGSTDSTSITPKVEVELLASGERRTVFQGDVTIRSDLLIATTYSPVSYSP